MLALLLAMAWTNPCMAEERLVISTVFTPPLSDLDGSGMLDRIVREACRRIGIKVEYIHLPGERSLQNANNGLIDGDILRIGDMERLYPNLVPVPEKIMDFEFVAFTRRQDVTIQDWASLRPFATSIVTGWKILEINVPAQGRVDVQNLGLLFTLMLKDRTDIVVHERYEGLWQARALGLEDVRVLLPPLAVREMYLYLNKKHHSLTEPLADALRAMKRDGTYSAIVRETLEPPGSHGPAQ